MPYYDQVASGTIQANRLQKSSNIPRARNMLSIFCSDMYVVGLELLDQDSNQNRYEELYSRSMHSQSQAESTYSLALCETITLACRSWSTFDNFILHLLIMEQRMLY